MSWTDVSSDGFFPQPASFINEFVSAIEERALLVGVNNLHDDYPDMFPISADDDVQGHLVWSRIQQWCEDNCIKFVQSWRAVRPDWIEADWDGRTELSNWTWENLGNYIKGDVDGGFRAYTTHPDDGGSPAYRHMAADDIISGPWISQDLQKALNALTWTKEVASPLDTYYRYGESISDPTEQFAWDAAKIDWDGNSWTGPSTLAPRTSVLMTGAAGNWRVYPADRIKGRWEKTGLSTLACGVDTLLLFGAYWPTYTFLAQGDGLATEDTYRRWSGSGVTAKGAGATTTGQTNIYNDDNTMPPSWDSSDPVPHGWEAHCYLVLDWGVVGGFTYRE